MKVVNSWCEVSIEHLQWVWLPEILEDIRTVACSSGYPGDGDTFCTEALPGLGADPLDPPSAGILLLWLPQPAASHATSRGQLDLDDNNALGSGTLKNPYIQRISSNISRSYAHCKHSIRWCLQLFNSFTHHLLTQNWAYKPNWASHTEKTWCD